MVFSTFWQLEISYMNAPFSQFASGDFIIPEPTQMNINKIRERPKKASSKTLRLWATFRPSAAFNSPASPTHSPEVP